MSRGIRPRLLVAECRGFPPEAADVLQASFDVRLADLDRSELLESVGDVAVLWVRLRHRIDGEILDAARQLKVIVSPTTGLNHIDLPSATRRGVRVLSLRGEVDFLRDIRATAELSLGLMIALLRKIPAALRHVREGGWRREEFQGKELYGRTVGVVGHGRLGRIVSRYLVALGATVLTTDPAVAPSEVEAGVRWVPLEELLGLSSLITLHVDLRPETQRFFGTRCFEAMTPGSFIVNTSRGELVDEEALLQALESGRLAGAALDVLAGETQAGLARHPLVIAAGHHEGLLVTPHIGGNTEESLTRVEAFLARKVAATAAEGLR